MSPGDSTAAVRAFDSANTLVPQVQLLDPPFDTFEPNPGYIRGYLSGVRENGGQYTRAAVWVAMAFAAARDATRAWDVATMLNPIHHAAGDAMHPRELDDVQAALSLPGYPLSKHRSAVQRSAADSWSTMTLDGVDCPDHAIVLVDDRREHAVHVRVQRTQD